MSTFGELRKLRESVDLAQGKEKQRLETKLFREERKMAKDAIKQAKKNGRKGVILCFEASEDTKNWINSKGFDIWNCS